MNIPPCLLNKDCSSNRDLRVMQIFQNPPWQYSKHQTRAVEIEKCLDEGLETTYYFSIFTFSLPKYGLFLHEIVECYDFEPHS